ncbi:MAG TPA: DUF4907 domain-containing protein [Flavisolibacter sp.]|nr:DUF4907 domain-containing protein [Flavisolibacter sp.]
MKTTRYVAGLALIMLLGSCRNERQKLSYTTFRTGRGWGYDILVNGATAIHQETKPALSADSGFALEDQASAAAKLVIRKLKERKGPSLSQEEVLFITSRP